MHGLLPRISKKSLNQNKIHLRCITQKINFDQPFWFPCPLHITETLKKYSNTLSIVNRLFYWEQ